MPGTHALYFLEASSSEVLPGRPAIIGLPFDRTTTFRSGTDKAPDAIRVASDSIETYSPFLERDLLDAPFADLGDLDFHGTKTDEIEPALAKIEVPVTRALSERAKTLAIGGEHTVTLPIVRVLARVHRDLVLVHADAHTDLRDDYDGNRLNHATVMKRVSEVIGPERMIQLGIRSGTREEFQWMRSRDTLLDWGPGAEEVLLRRIRDRPVYLSLDLDVLDPACFPGTGNPEPGGWFYKDMERLLLAMTRVHLVGADVVELNPGLDPSGASSVTAAKITRELLLIL